MEKSIGKKETFELAVMVDTFSPLMVTEDAVNLTVGQYHTSWLNKK
jgi:homogentisate 1,2-dioxygenase